MVKENFNAYLINDGRADDGTLDETWLVHEHEQKDFNEHCEKAKQKLKNSGKWTIFGFEIAEILVEENGYILLTDFLKDTYSN